CTLPDPHQRVRRQPHMRMRDTMNLMVKQNVILSLAVIAMLIVANFLQFFALPFGVMGHEGITFLVILNGLRLLKGNN
ncbi:hypothetical protein, partial [Bacillus sp. S1-R2T1-FB]|uniref:hypothetical protein n=1 Tax=Bacillus sp. S1-R2T1-FB TaxID=1973493 RepID=UPI001154F8D4